MTPRTLLLTLLVTTATAATAAGPVPASGRWAVRPLADVDLVTTPGFDRAALAVEDEARDAEGLPWRFALPEDVQLTPDNAGTWDTLPDGRILWRIRLRGPGALSMNLGLTRFYLPAGAVLFVYAPGEEDRAQVYDERDNADHGQLWTPVVLGDEVVVEAELDPRDRPDLGLEIGRINRGYRLFGDTSADKSGFCNVDVICPEGDDWRDQIDTVAVITVSGSIHCSGFMVNNTARDGRPLFITATHCSLNSGNDQSLVVYWNYQSPVCGQQGGGSLQDVQTGSTWLARTTQSDFTIVELGETPDPAWNVKYAGWNRGAAPPTSAVGIHHPQSDEKSISFENDPLIVSSYYGNTTPGDATHLRVEDWDLGTTEGGSSGSPLFDQDGYVVGELHGGDAACINNASDWYGRLAFAWAEGSTDSTRLSPWLDPAGTGETVLPLYDPAAPHFTVAPETDADFTGMPGGPFSPDQMVYTLANPGTQAAPFVVAFAEAWLTAVPASGSIPVAGQVQVQVALTAAADALPTGSYEDTLEFAVPGAQGPLASRAVRLTVGPEPPEVAGPIPNPFVDYTEIQFRLATGGPARARILDVHGRLLRDLGTRDFPAGLNRWAWDGSDGAGRRLAAGLYVFELQAEGQTRRFPVTFVR